VIRALRIALLGVSACGLTADFSGIQGGAPKADAGSGGYCASLSPAPRLCADFDEGALGPDWSRVDVSAGATAILDATARTPPASFLSAFTLESAAPVFARLEKTLPLEATYVHVGFDLLLDASVGSLELAVIYQRVADGTGYGLFYKEDDGGKLLLYSKALPTEGGDVSERDDTIGVPPTDWVRVEIDVSFGDDGSYIVKHDGAVVVSEAHLPTATPSRVDQSVAIGFNTPKTASGRAHFDDVVIDWH